MLRAMPSRPAAEDRRRQQIRIGGAVGEPELEALAARDADHMRAVVAGIGHGVGDHVAPDNVTGALMRLYEFTVGLVMAQMSPAEFINPPMKL